MHLQTGWDTFLADTTSLIDVYHCGTVRFDFNLRQMTLPAGR